MSIFGTIVKHVACFLVAHLAFGLATLPLALVYSRLGVTIEGWHTFIVILVGLAGAIIAYRYTLSLFARHPKAKPDENRIAQSESN